MKTLIEILKESAHFQFYRDGGLYYKTDSGFMFRVPVDDAGTGTFKSDDKAILFMRWIRPDYSEVLAEQVEAETIS